MCQLTFDVVARYSIKGLMSCIRWDGMRLAPAENATMERGVHPGKWTVENNSMRTQLRSMGLSYDWARELPPVPDYYQHEQKMFLKFLEAGLAIVRKLGELGPGGKYGSCQ